LRSNGTKAVTGNPTIVSGTQQYSKNFGQTIARIYANHFGHIRTEAEQRFEAACRTPQSFEMMLAKLKAPRDLHNEWAIAKLDDVFTFLN
jgi:hypothetical protein